MIERMQLKFMRLVLWYLHCIATGEKSSLRVAEARTNLDEEIQRILEA